ncbi:pterin-4-alpha-carbinolamine dehydratase [Thiocystis minor]|uniref:4a-hydroxytetrahydrobiopterin dehydratase n=1 Tax=Thiocystis minor TaxID=61597 RepID=UPI001912CF2F|nr:4a-hydroxytetrahydrobiopterin dehydratase [Thiocystis minor]MBK5965370.1 pterin-4-alpha-carbinolamine dehydratase [Thiocystis minor]
MTATQQGWKRRERPPRLERRLEFDDYEQTRDFLDAVAVICEPGGYYPDISFGRTYANISIHAEQDAADIAPERLALAERIEELMSARPTPGQP